MKNAKKGISLIVLVITIIVMIIIAGAIILTLTNGNVIAKAKEAKFKSDMRNIQDEAGVYISGNLANDGTYSYPVKSQIKSADKYATGIVTFSKDKLVYRTSDINEKLWAEQLGIIVDYTDGLIANYKFNGDVNNNEPYGMNGTITRVVPTIDRNGKSSGAYNFTGDSCVAVSNNALISFNETQSLTLSVWIKTTIGSASGNAKILSKRRSELTVVYDSS